VLSLEAVGVVAHVSFGKMVLLMVVVVVEV